MGKRTSKRTETKFQGATPIKKEEVSKDTSSSVKMKIRLLLQGNLRGKRSIE